MQLEAAISSTIFLLIAKEKTVAHAIDQAILHYLQEVKDTHSRCVHHRELCGLLGINWNSSSDHDCMLYDVCVRTHTHTHRWLLQAVSKVTIDDLQQVGKEYFSRLFDPALTTTAVCCNPSKVTEVKNGLEQ